MARIIQNTTYKAQDGTPYRMEVWDNDSAPTGLGEKVELGAGGFDIQWEGREGEPSPVFLPSSMSFTMYLTPAQRAEFMASVWGDVEFNTIIRLYRTNYNDNEKLFWAGVVLPESVSETIEDGYVSVSVKATDGISLLKEVNFVDDSLVRYDDSKSAIEWLYECLKKVPTHSYVHDFEGAPHFLQERMIMRPTTDAQTTFPDSDAVLDTMFIHSNALYSVKVEEARQRSGFEQRKAPKNMEFLSTYEVLYNIVSSLGATLCLGEGTWQLFDKERVVNLADDPAAGYFNWYLDGTWFHNPFTAETAQEFDADGKNLLLGATRTAEYPIAAALQTHAGAGSDLIWRSGDGWMMAGPSWAGRRPTVTQYTGASSANYNLVHLFRGTRGENNSTVGDGRTVYFVDTSNHTQAMGNLGGDMLNNPTDGIINGLLLPTGDNGGIFSFGVGGNATFRGAGPFINETLPIGTTGLYRQYLEVNDGTNSFRFRRRMRTYPYTSSGTAFTIDIQNAGSANDYVARYYETGFWVRDDDARYETAYLDVMIGCDPTVLDMGESDQFLQTDFTTTAFYTPPRTKASPDADNVLIKSDDDGRQHFEWSFRANISTPLVSEGASVPFTSMRVWNPRYVEIQAATKYAAARNSSGTPIDVKLTEALDNIDISAQLAEAVTAASGGTAYASATESGLAGKPAEGFWNATEVFELSGMHIYTGTGTEEWDVDHYANMDSPKGSEFMQLNTTALGATYVNTGNRAFGRWTAKHPLNPTVEENNLKFMRFNDAVTVTNSMGALVANNALEVRGETRQLITGTVISNGADYGKDLLAPYKAFKTSKFGGGTTEWFVPMRVAFNGDGQQALAAIKCSTWTPKPTTEEEHATGFVSGAGVNTGVGPHPNGGGVSRAWNKAQAAEDVTEHLDASGFTGSMTLSEIQSKIDFVQTTSPITDDDLGGAGGSTKFGDLFPIFIKRF